MQKSYTITKKIAKHGKQAIIVIPSFLQSELSPNTIVEVRINVLKNALNEGMKKESKEVSKNGV